jgi:hypothetical protein
VPLVIAMIRSASVGPIIQATALSFQSVITSARCGLGEAEQRRQRLHVSDLMETSTTIESHRVGFVSIKWSAAISRWREKMVDSFVEWV